MFRFLNKIIHRNFLKRTSGSTKGQAAIVLILVIAIVLIFYAVTLNFGHFSQIKGMVTVASNTSTSMMASSMASYAQMLSETNLKGKYSRCGPGPVVGALVAVVIVALMIAFPPAGAGAAAATSATATAVASAASTLLVAGSVLAFTSFVAQVAIINPGQTSAWNRIMQGTGMSADSQISENAIQSALSKMVTDGVTVPDVTDMDRDGIWVAEGDISSPPYADTVGRYAAYYDHRLKEINQGPTEEVKKFLAALDEFVHEDCDATASWGAYCDGIDGGWGVHDPMDSETCFGTAECNPCCLPHEELRPEECSGALDTDGNLINWQTKCGGESPYGSGYPWVYDPAFENPYNEFYSFRELIGKDDEHQDFYKDNPSTDPPEENWDPNSIPQNEHVPSTERGFYLEDATNYYVPEAYNPDGPEIHKGVYPFFHKMAQWGVELSTVDPDANLKECHWRDQREGSDGDFCVDIFDGPHPYPVEVPQLDLPLDPEDLAINTTYRVDGNNNALAAPGVDPPLWVDKVELPTDIIADSNMCTEDSLSTGEGFWKPGGDRFCKTEWPYSIGCAKNAGSCGDLEMNCACGEAGGTAPRSEFHDDLLDGLYGGLGGFTVWAEALLAQANENLDIFASNFSLWYPEAAGWVEPSGPLDTFRDEIVVMKSRVEGWITNHSSDPKGYASEECNEVWCIPRDPSACPLIQDDERAIFNANGGVVGDVEDIIACLDHNVDNAVRFQACYDSCNACALDESDCSSLIVDACGGTDTTFLPRSLIPGFDPNADFEPPDIEQIADIQACVSGECGTCFVACESADDKNACRALCTCKVSNSLTIGCTATDIANAAAPLRGSCGDTDPDSYLDFLRRSIPEAKNQGEKFKNRKNFLENRVAEARDVADRVFNPAISQFDTFLTNSVKYLDNAKSGAGLSSEGLPYHAIYGWKDENDPDGSEGKWHIIKAEARITGHCDGFCGVGSPPSADPGMPWISRHNKSLGMETCYNLENTTGLVKFRAVRYDEERDSGVFSFPNGTSIWNFRTRHPKRLHGTAFQAGQLGEACDDNSTIKTFDDGSSAGGIYDGAFMMKDLDDTNAGCWNLANNLLTRGVVTETCAKYSWMAGDPKNRMNFVFVPCEDF